MIEQLYPEPDLLELHAFITLSRSCEITTDVILIEYIRETEGETIAMAQKLMDQRVPGCRGHPG